ncbi:MAG: hypothetical protein DKINENOH_01694 [bacterium]|nr:hypothetical protein [bacterium]
MTLNGEKLQLKYLPLEQVLLWDDNPKKHDVGGLIQSIKTYGFVDPPKFDPSLNGGKGGVVYGNGRSQGVKLIRTQTPNEPPRGVLVDDKGGWYLPVLFGLDAESEAVAQALAIDHNNLTMAGGDFDLWDYAKMWNQESYAEVLRSLAACDVPPVTMSQDDIATYLRVIENGVAAKEFSEGIAEGVALEALFKIRVPAENAGEFETPLRELLTQFPQAKLEKIV